MNKKKIIRILRFLILPFFPENKELKKHWWHKLVKIIVLITTVSSLFALFWIASLFYFNFPKTILDAMYWASWLPLNFANLFSYLPIYGTIFRATFNFLPLGPFTLPFVLVLIFYFLPSLLYRLILTISQKFYLRKVRIMFPLLIAGLILFSVYIAKFQEIINEGSYLADEHCIKINPLIIDRKNKYMDQYNLMLEQADSGLIMNALSNYRKSSVAYINEEKLWLSKDRNLLDSKMYNFLMPPYIKEAANYQYRMYEAQYLASVYLEQEWDEKDENKKIELSNKVIDETKKSNEVQDKYNAVWDNKNNTHWMFNFVKAPPPKCPAANYNIPVIPNPFAPPAPTVREESAG